MSTNERVALAMRLYDMIGEGEWTTQDVAGKVRHAAAEVLPAEDVEWIEPHLLALAGLSEEAALGGDRRNEAFAAWRRFLEGMAEQRPLVVVFEDLHWADESLLDFVDELVDWVVDVPLLVVATARPELLDRRPGWGGGKLNAITLALAPLTNDETAELLGSALGSPVVAAETQAALLEAKVNPVPTALPVDRYAGSYDGNRAVTLQDGKLNYQRTGGPKVALTPVGPNEFGFDEDPGMRIQFAVAGDRVTSLKLVRGDGSTVNAPRTN